MQRSSLLSLHDMLTQALLQDRGLHGDVTTMSVIDEGMEATGVIGMKAEKGIVSGLLVAQEVFAIADPSLVFIAQKKDGDMVQRGDVVATVSGNARAILMAERVALEFVRRMSGIATQTRAFVDAVSGTGVTILDTRKLAPGFGALDKQAVRDGGGKNHRMNLSEMGFIKNNHIDLLHRAIGESVARFRKAYPTIPLEVEVRTMSELQEALSASPDRILLDNMTLRRTSDAVNMRNVMSAQVGAKILLEASGNITLRRIRAVAKTGVEYISVGSLTHSVHALDMSLHLKTV